MQFYYLVGFQTSLVKSQNHVHVVITYLFFFSSSCRDSTFGVGTLRVLLLCGCPIHPTIPPLPTNSNTMTTTRAAIRPFLVPARGPLFTRVQTGLGRLVATADQHQDNNTITRLTTVAHQSPFRWIPNRASAVQAVGAVAVVASNYGGGLLPGDAVHTVVKVQPRATLAVGTQGANRVYPQGQTQDHQPRPSQLTARYDVAPGALLVVAPDPTTPFADSILHQQQAIHLHYPNNDSHQHNNNNNNNPSLCWIDWMAAGRTARGERWQARSVTSRTELWCHNQKSGTTSHRQKHPTLVDAVRWTKEEDSCTVKAMGDCQAYATVLLTGPQTTAVQDACRLLASTLTAPYTAVVPLRQSMEKKQEKNEEEHTGATMTNADNENAGHALRSTLAGPVWMGVSTVGNNDHTPSSNHDEIMVVRLAATNNDDIYRVLHHALLPLQARLGFAPYQDRIRGVHSAAAPVVVPTQTIPHETTKPQTSTPFTPLPMSPATIWAAHMLTDSSLPTGGFAHSAGLEVAAQVGWLRTLASEHGAVATYAAATIHSTLQQVTPTLRRVHEAVASRTLDAAVWQDIQQELHALLVANGPACRASLDQGASLWRLAQTWIPDVARPALLASPQVLHYAPVFGLLTSAWGLSLDQSRYLLAYCVGRDVVSAAVRLNLVGPLASVPLLAQICNAVPPLDTENDMMGASSAPVLEALQPLHDVLAVRLFRT